MRQRDAARALLVALMWVVAVFYGRHFWRNWRDGVAETLVRHPYLNNEVRAYYSRRGSPDFTIDMGFQAVITLIYAGLAVAMTAGLRKSSRWHRRIWRR